MTARIWIACVVLSVEASYYFPNVDVLTTACGNRQLRPRGMHAVGDRMVCGLCNP